MNLPARRKYKAYTLLELLIVLAIFLILSTIGMSAFNGFRDTITLNEEIDELKQNIRSAQRASLFLERQTTERWIYGIGLDFSQIENNGSYRMFKWCAPFNEFGDIRSKQNVPNYNPSLQLSTTNGNLGISTPYSSTICEQGLGLSEIVRYGSGIDNAFGINFRPIIPDNNGVTGDIGNVPAYVLFESVSGKAFFYDIQGNIINYRNNGDMVASPVNFVLQIESPNTGRLKTITIFNISGKIQVEDRKL